MQSSVESTFCTDLLIGFDSGYVTTVKSNIVQLPPQLPIGMPVRARIQIVRGFKRSEATPTLKVVLKSSDTVASRTPLLTGDQSTLELSSPDTIGTSVDFKPEEIVPGFIFDIDFYPRTKKKHMVLEFVFSAKPTLAIAGVSNVNLPMVTAFVPMGASLYEVTKVADVPIAAPVNAKPTS